MLACTAMRRPVGVDGDRKARRDRQKTAFLDRRQHLGNVLAVLKADHLSASPFLLKTASSFRDNTSSAAVSAKALSLLRSSRSSSLMRCFSCLVCCGVARASSGSASACMALWRHAANSCGYRPCARHQTFLLASSMAAVVSTASNRAAAVQTRCCVGCAMAWTRQYSRVPTLMPISRETTSIAELSGGSSLATAISFNSLPYRATSNSFNAP